MKRLLQDRKTLYLVLAIVMVSVFTLSVAYAAMSAVLEIHGNSEIVASSWDIHLENAQVKSGSVSANAPVISGNSTLAFNVELNTPGEFYEFTVDVVNEGSIDAMIDSVVKTPITGTSYAKYIKYEVSYENGESISTKQTLKKGTSTPIKVRVEYRKDLVASDLPSSAIELSLKLTLVYVQSDGTGNEITNNGAKLVKVLSGDGTQVGDEICIDTECFYVISSTDTTVTMLAKYNLYVGGVYNNGWTAYGDEATGKQDLAMLGWISEGQPYNGTTAFSSVSQKGTNYSDYSGSIVEGYVNNYKAVIEDGYGIDVVEARLITKTELTSDEIGCSSFSYSCSEAPDWVYSTSYWSGTAYYSDTVWLVKSGGFFGSDNYDDDSNVYGVRPVITISRDYL